MGDKNQDQSIMDKSMRSVFGSFLSFFKERISLFNKFYYFSGKYSI